MNSEEKLRLRFKQNKNINLFDSFLQKMKPIPLELKLKDVLENNVDKKYFLKQEQVDKLFSHLKNQKDKGNTFGVDALPMDVDDCSRTLSARDYKGPKCIELTCDVSQAMRVFSDEGTACTLRGLGGGMGAKTGLYALGCALRGRSKNEDGSWNLNFESNKEECSNALTKVQKDSLVSISLFPRSSVSGKGGTGTLVKSDGSSYCLDSGNCQAIVQNRVRRLTPKECFRLQGFLNDEVNLDGLSDTQKYKLAGNGQSVNVVKLLLKELF